MVQPETLEEVILSEGMEDLIPLAEIALTASARGLLTPKGTTQVLSEALLKLLRAGNIRVFCGYWSNEPEPVASDVAELLLSDLEKYVFNSESDLRSRVYYANVESLLD